MEIEGAILSPEAAKRKVSYTDFGRSDFLPIGSHQRLLHLKHDPWIFLPEYLYSCCILMRRPFLS